MHVWTNIERLRALLALLLLTLAVTPSPGCTVDDASVAGADGGPAGDDAAAAPCATTGTGTLDIAVTGLPEGVSANVTITGPAGAPTDVTASITMADAGAGMYLVVAERVANMSAIVRTVYQPALSLESFCLADSKPQTVTVAYTKLASSNTLWASNSNSDSGDLLGFASPVLSASGNPSATVDAKAAVGRAFAFDNEGNLWTVAGTTAHAPVSRFAAADLGASGTKTPDRELVPELTGCSPALTALAFDSSGALWAADLCGDRLIRFSPDTLGASAEYTLDPDDIASGTIEAPRGIAFDTAGNMWVSDTTSLHRYPSASLAPGQPHVPTFTLSAKTERVNRFEPGTTRYL